MRYLLVLVFCHIKQSFLFNSCCSSKPSQIENSSQRRLTVKAFHTPFTQGMWKAWACHQDSRRLRPLFCLKGKNVREYIPLKHFILLHSCWGRCCWFAYLFPCGTCFPISHLWRINASPGISLRSPIPGTNLALSGLTHFYHCRRVYFWTTGFKKLTTTIAVKTMYWID